MLKKVTADIAGERPEMNKGDAIIAPAGTSHKFTNAGRHRAVTFSLESFRDSPQAY